MSDILIPFHFHRLRLGLGDNNVTVRRTHFVDFNMKVFVNITESHTE